MNSVALVADILDSERSIVVVFFKVVQRLVLAAQANQIDSRVFFVRQVELGILKFILIPNLSHSLIDMVHGVLVRGATIAKNVVFIAAHAHLLIDNQSRLAPEVICVHHFKTYSAALCLSTLPIKLLS